MRPSRPVRRGADEVLGCGARCLRLRASQLELALEIGQGHIHIAHGHARIGVAEQFHDRGEAHAGAKHFRSVSVAQLMRDDTGGQSC